MTFAELQYDQHYSDFHSELVALIEDHFPNVESGLQGDSWIWVFDGDEKVAIDTFSSMKHQVKCSDSASDLLQRILALLVTKYSVTVFDNPEAL